MSGLLIKNYGRLWLSLRCNNLSGNSKLIDLETTSLGLKHALTVQMKFSINVWPLACCLTNINIIFLIAHWEQ